MKNAPVCLVLFFLDSRNGIERRVDKVGLCLNHGKDAAL
jgi:hypothetical protein